MNRSEAGKLGWLKSKNKLEILAQNQHDEAVKRYDLSPKICKNCNKQISYERRQNDFCNSSCSAYFNNKIKPRRKRTYRATCRNCGVLKYDKNIYCENCINLECHIHRAKSLAVCKTDGTRRRFLIKQYGHKCWACKNTTWNSEAIPIELDHIDGNHNNNDENNLRLLCPNCHALTPTYKNKNKGNGRLNRRLRYQKNTL